jgi:hypothetical protein
MEIMPSDAYEVFIAQAFGVAAAACGMGWPLFRGRVGMLATQACCGAFFTVHFLAIGADTAAVMNALAAAQAAAAIPLGERPGFRYAYLALLPVIAVGVWLTWAGGPSLAAAAGTVLVSVARYQVNVRRFRLFMAIALPCWFVHNLWVFSIPGMLSDVTGMIINTWMLRRDWREQSSAPSESGSRV